MTSEISEDLGAIVSSLIIALPSINGEAPGYTAGHLDSLTERTIGVAGMGAQLDQEPRRLQGNKLETDRNESVPARDVRQPLRHPEHGWVHQRAKVSHNSQT